MESPEKTLLAGNWIMVLCGAFYLAWWIIVFRPPRMRSSPVGWGMLSLAFMAGIVGVYLMGKALNTPVPEIHSGMRGLWIVAAGAVCYAILLWASTALFHRQVTSELLIITAWAVLELCTVNFLYRGGAVAQTPALILAGMVLAGMMGSLVCYLLYYRLAYVQSFIVGCIPLALAEIIMITINCVTNRS